MKDFFILTIFYRYIYLMSLFGKNLKISMFINLNNKIDYGLWITPFKYVFRKYVIFLFFSKKDNFFLKYFHLLWVIFLIVSIFFYRKIFFMIKSSHTSKDNKNHISRKHI
jgi:hypothetical protein